MNSFLFGREKAGTDTLTMLNTEPIFKEQKTLKFADKLYFLGSIFMQTQYTANILADIFRTDTFQTRHNDYNYVSIHEDINVHNLHIYLLK